MFLPSVGDGIPDVTMRTYSLTHPVKLKINSPSPSSPDGDRILRPSVIVLSDDGKKNA